MPKRLEIYAKNKLFTYIFNDLRYLFHIGTAIAME